MILVLISYEKKPRHTGSSQHILDLSAGEGPELELTPFLPVHPQTGLGHTYLRLLSAGITHVCPHLVPPVCLFF